MGAILKAGLAGIFTVGFLVSSPALAHRMTESTEAAAAQDDPFADVVIEVTELAEGLHMLTGQGGNIGVSSGPDGVFMIDNQFAPLSEKILAAVAGISDQPLRYVVNTHWHFDHTGGNENMANAGAMLIAHENVRERMSTDQVVEAWGRTIPASPDAALPVLTYADGITFHLNGQAIRLIHIPGAHTDGDTIIYFPDADLIHMGDTLFNGFYPFIDVGAGGNINGMIEALDRAMEIAGPETKIIPGHGPLATRVDLARNREVLDLVRMRVMEQARTGKTLEEVVAMDLMADYNEDWEAFINGDQIVTFAFQSMMKTSDAE